MKKVILGTTITLVLLLSGCGENEIEQKGKVQFARDIETLGSSKAVNMAEASFGKEKVEEWIKELKEKGQWKEENLGKTGKYNF